MLVSHNVSGVQVHEARLVAAMRVHGVGRILTFNAEDFARYTDVEAIERFSHKRNAFSTVAVLSRSYQLWHACQALVLLVRQLD